MARRRMLSSIRVTASDDESEDEDNSANFKGTTQALNTDRDSKGVPLCDRNFDRGPNGIPLSDRATDSDDRVWFGGRRVMERWVWGPQPLSAKQVQHELAYHKSAGLQNGVPYKAGDPDLLEMSKHLESEAVHRYMRLHYPCTNSRCKILKACLLSENCEIRMIVYDPREKLPYTTGCKLRVSGLVKVENEQ